jgi:hypothetical protein
MRLEAMRLTRTLNLGTSLKNYISPYAVKDLCDQVGVDWKRFYPKALIRKFSFLDSTENDSKKDAMEEKTRAQIKV